jgi:hypothetical protein
MITAEVPEFVHIPEEMTACRLFENEQAVSCRFPC